MVDTGEMPHHPHITRAKCTPPVNKPTWLILRLPTVFKRDDAERRKSTVPKTLSARRSRWTPTSALSARSSIAQPTIFCRSQKATARRLVSDAEVATPCALFQASTARPRAALRWARRLTPERRFALEDCRHISGRLEPALIAAGERCVRVPPKLMAQTRRSARSRGKSDAIDAATVARAALPEARLAGPERGLRLLVDHCSDLIGECTRLQQCLRWHLHALGLEVPPKAPLRCSVPRRCGGNRPDVSLHLMASSRSVVSKRLGHATTPSSLRSTRLLDRRQHLLARYPSDAGGGDADRGAVFAG